MTAFTQTPTDTSGLTDTGVVEGTAGVTTDASGNSDAFVPERVFTDPSGLTDSAVAARSLVFTDTSGSTDNESESVNTVITDSAGSADSSSKTLSPVLTDSTGLTATHAYSQGDVETDRAGVTDIGVVEGLLITVFDSTGADDDASAVVASSIKTVSQTDPTGITDAGLSQGRSGLTNDTAGLTDSTVRTKTTSLAWTASPNDNSPLSDSGSIRNVAETQTDAAGASDALVFRLAFVVNDDSGSSDSATEGLTHVFTQNDDAGLVDAIGGTDRGLNPTDAMALADEAPTTHDPGGTNWTVTQTDRALTADTAGLDRPQRAADDSGITDDASMSLTRALIFTDDAGLNSYHHMNRDIVLVSTDEIDAYDLAATSHELAMTILDDALRNDRFDLINGLEPTTGYRRELVEFIDHREVVR